MPGVGVEQPKTQPGQNEPEHRQRDRDTGRAREHIAQGLAAVRRRQRDEGVEKRTKPNAQQLQDAVEQRAAEENR